MRNVADGRQVPVNAQHAASRRRDKAVSSRPRRPCRASQRRPRQRQHSQQVALLR
jgi:hypothetical protein